MLAITSRKNTLLFCGPVPSLTHNTAPIRDLESERGSGKIQLGSKKDQLFSRLTLEGRLCSVSCQLLPNFPGHVRGCPQPHPKQGFPKQLVVNTLSSPRYCGSSPSSLSSYSTRNPDTVSEAETQETTKLLAVISVTDSEVATTGEKGVVSPVTVLPRVIERGERAFSHGGNLLASSVDYQVLKNVGAIHGIIWIEMEGTSCGEPRSEKCGHRWAGGWGTYWSPLGLCWWWWSRSASSLFGRSAGRWWAGPRIPHLASGLWWCRSLSGPEWWLPSNGLENFSKNLS